MNEERDWARARTLLGELIEVARTGREPLTYGAVGEMFDTGPRNIHGNLLNKLDSLCEQYALPHLRTLVVRASAGLPAGAWAGFDTPEEKRAAQSDCYRFFGTAVPESVSRLGRRARGSGRIDSQEPRPVPTCKSCQIALPATGLCDDCD